LPSFEPRLAVPAANIRLRTGQPCGPLDDAPHAWIGNAFLPGLEWSGDIACHEDPAGLAERIVDTVREDLAIRTAKAGFAAAVRDRCSSRGRTVI
jgi:hypothetical protein